jgi:hypothetical protein
MTTRRSDGDPGPSELDLLQALVALYIADRDDRVAENPSLERAEVVLSRAGLSAAQIASISGKGYESVRGVIRRSRSRSADTSDGTNGKNGRT